MRTKNQDTTKIRRVINIPDGDMSISIKSNMLSPKLVVAFKWNLDGLGGHQSYDLAFAITGAQKQNEAALLHVRVDGIVICLCPFKPPIIICRAPKYETNNQQDDS